MFHVKHFRAQRQFLRPTLPRTREGIRSNLRSIHSPRHPDRFRNFHELRRGASVTDFNFVTQYSGDVRTIARKPQDDAFSRGAAKGAKRGEVPSSGTRCHHPSQRAAFRREIRPPEQETAFRHEVHHLSARGRPSKKTCSPAKPRPQQKGPPRRTTRTRKPDKKTLHALGRIFPASRTCTFSRFLLSAFSPLFAAFPYAKMNMTRKASEATHMSGLTSPILPRAIISST